MDSWMADIDRLGLEAFLEASSMSAPLYRKYGFIEVECPKMVFRRENPSEDWLGLVHDMRAHPISIMWRPKCGICGGPGGSGGFPWKAEPRQQKL